MDILTLSKQLEHEGIVPTVRVFKRGDYLFKAGSKHAPVFLIENGSVQILCDIDDHLPQIIRFGYNGSIITALDTFFTNCASVYSIQAIKQTKVHIYNVAEIITFFNATHQGQLIWKKILEDLVLQQMEREIDLLITDPKLRYERVLQRSAKLFQEVPHKYIANYLRMTPETLSRLKKS